MTLKSQLSVGDRVVGTHRLPDELIHQQYAQGALGRAELTNLAAMLVVARHETMANMISHTPCHHRK